MRLICMTEPFVSMRDLHVSSQTSLMEITCHLLKPLGLNESNRGYCETWDPCIFLACIPLGISVIPRATWGRRRCASIIPKRCRCSLGQNKGLVLITVAEGTCQRSAGSPVFTEIWISSVQNWKHHRQECSASSFRPRYVCVVKILLARPPLHQLSPAARSVFSPENREKKNPQRMQTGTTFGKPRLSQREDWSGREAEKKTRQNAQIRTLNCT